MYDEDVFLESRIGNVKREEEVSPFIACLESYWKGDTVEELEHPGQVAAREIEVNIPDKADDSPSPAGTAVLCIRLADEGEDHLINNVALFRGAGMVVEYLPWKRLSLSARDFHGILVCGLARKPGNHTSGDRALEEFLSAAEPPAHNTWDSTRSLKNTYKRGYKKAIDDLIREAKDAARELVTASRGDGGEGPVRLMKRFPIGKKGGAGLGGRPFHFEKIRAYLSEAGMWEFEGRIRPSTDDHSGWNAEIEMLLVGESGDKEDCPIISFVTDPEEGVEISIDGGKSRLSANSGVDEIKFEGEGDPADVSPQFRRVGAELIVDGELKKGGA